MPKKRNTPAKIARGRVAYETTRCNGAKITFELAGDYAVWCEGTLPTHEARFAKAERRARKYAGENPRPSLDEAMAGWTLAETLQEAAGRRADAANPEKVADYEADRADRIVRGFKPNPFKEALRIGRHWPYVVEQLAAEGVFPEQDA
jgi:hypothetical protein